MTKVLFICLGNICRSPMAEFIFKDKVEKLGIADQFEIASAATSSEEVWNGVGNPVYPPAKAELAKHGITCEGKRAVQVTRKDYDHYDYLICMEQNNIHNTKRIVGEDIEHKIVRLLDYGDRPRDIADPWFTGNFISTYNDIVEGLDDFLSFLQNIDKI